MTHTISFPSEAAPAFPSLSLSVPDDWKPLAVSGAVLAAGKSVEQGQFRPNVVVAVSRFAPGYALATAVEGVIKRVEAIEGVAELGRDELDVLGQPGYRIEFSYPDPRVGLLMQAVRIAVIDHGTAVDLVQITATASGPQAQEYWGELREVQASASLGGATGAA
ncbi:hypothetical protein N1031_03110 [Herbiconiux moechotypicola]|uniref:Lipoprotein LpqN n=1 Tax=Herbiconiux moechotypicola TaxID=637393 RepID=A0ABP5Q6M2_9MICO|nr:hypothetical protein [Herbiconiux moechotypicola]MCS5728737.1 hypothetical protein [Herbiconiux moechotypicola]